MGREIPSRHEMHHFTPIFDSLIERYDLMTAAVYGRVWRFCQMKEGVCFATVARIAEEAGVNYRTALRRLKLLCKDGYLEDLTPGLRNAPHRYRLTGKLDLVHMSVTTVADTTSYDRESDEAVGTPHVTESQTPHVTESQSTSYDRESDEDSIRENNNSTGVAASHTENGYRQALKALEDIGFRPTADAERYARRDPAAALGWATYAQREDLGGGWVRQRLDAGDPVPSTPSKTTTPPPGEVFR